MEDNHFVTKFLVILLFILSMGSTQRALASFSYSLPVVCYSNNTETMPNNTLLGTGVMLGFAHCISVSNAHLLQSVSAGGVWAHQLLYVDIVLIILFFMFLGVIPTLIFNRWKYSYMILFSCYLIVLIIFLLWGVTRL